MKQYIFTCEHAGNYIPEKYKYLFSGHQTLLNSHRGYDIGIFELFEYVRGEINAPTFYSKISRLLLELNRSPFHKKLFSEISNRLDAKSKSELLKKYYQPYREEVESTMEKFFAQNIGIVHLSFHSFTPELYGEIRNADIGLLYDPKSETEKLFSKRWKSLLLKANSDLNVRFNYPYLGISDGFTNSLRHKFANEDYCGIELEINQRLLRNGKEINKLAAVISNSLKNLLTD